MPRPLAHTFSDPEWPFHASRAISAVAELLVTALVSCLEQRQRGLIVNVIE